MPYKSEQQRKFFHTPGAIQAGIKSKQVEEYDKSSKGLSLPDVVKPKVSAPSAPISPRYAKIKKLVKGY